MPSAAGFLSSFFRVQDLLRNNLFPIFQCRFLCMTVPFRFPTSEVEMPLLLSPSFQVQRVYDAPTPPIFENAFWLLTIVFFFFPWRTRSGGLWCFLSNIYCLTSCMRHRRPKCSAHPRRLKWLGAKQLARRFLYRPFSPLYSGSSLS